MLRVKNKLTVLHDDNSTFTDYSTDAIDFDRDSITIALNASEDYLYVGFEKAINTFYVEVGNANANAGSFTAEFYNGTTWTALVGFFDETKSFTRSGFLRWDRNQTDDADVAVNGTTARWVRFRPSVTHSATLIKGINIVFADDADLKREYFEIDSFLPKDESSFILTHVASRDHMIQELRNSGNFKQDINTGLNKDITAFDLLDTSQVKMAATYLALYKIFIVVSDDVDDKWSVKAKEYKSLYKIAMNTFYLDIDTDNDGTQDLDERLAPNTFRLVRR
jgi:hypothetical protein